MDCSLCGFISRNKADFSVSFGKEDRSMQVCRWCERDLALLNFKSNQVVWLHDGQKKRSLKLVLGRAFSLTIAPQPPCLSTSQLFLTL